MNESPDNDEILAKLHGADRAGDTPKAHSDADAELAKLELSEPGKRYSSVGIEQELRALASDASGEPTQTEHQMEELRQTWNESWEKEEERPVVRREMASLFRLVSDLADDSRGVVAGLSMLLGAIRPFRAVGWVLFGLSMLDIVILAIGFQPMNPKSELDSLYELAERCATPLIGAAMIFAGRPFRRGAIELKLIKGLSWFCLVLAIGYLGSLPLGINDTIRVNEIRHSNTAASRGQLESNVEGLRNMLQQADTPEKLAAVVTRVTGRQVTTLDPTQAEKVRSQLEAAINEAEKRKAAELTTQIADTREAFWLRVIKMHIELLFAGIVFFFLWRITEWSRKFDPNRAEPQFATDYQ